jgi:hypothetical protein
MALHFQIGIDTQAVNDLLPALLQAREQLAIGPLSASSLEHLLPVGESGIGCYKLSNASVAMSSWLLIPLASRNVLRV